MRKYGGIRKLVRLLKARAGSKEEAVAISGALALATCSKSGNNKILEIPEKYILYKNFERDD